MPWEHTVVACNTATESTNRMHDDTVARTYGFAGGLVPGVDVWAYLTNPCVTRWGTEFLTTGTMEARFLAPVYDGEEVTARLDDDGSLTVVGRDGDVRADGSAWLGELPAPAAIDHAPRPDSVPDADPSAVAAGTVLGTLHCHYRQELAAAYLRDVRETSEVYEGGAVCHPGFLARQANYVLSKNVRLGPWIHVGTRAHHRGLVRDGDPLEVRGVVVDEREHKGHRFVDLDVVVLCGERPIWSAFHTAIWRPRPR